MTYFYRTCPCSKNRSCRTHTLNLYLPGQYDPDHIHVDDTSVWMLGTDPVLPFDMAVLELLGLLGPEPGALLHMEETGPHRHRK